MTTKCKYNFICRQCDKAFTCQSNKNRHEKSNIFVYFFFPRSEVYLETCRISMMVSFSEIINN